MFPENTRRLSNAVLMLVHRLRRWPNINTASDKRLVCAGLGLSSYSFSPTWLDSGDTNYTFTGKPGTCV